MVPAAAPVRAGCARGLADQLRRPRAALPAGRGLPRRAAAAVRRTRVRAGEDRCYAACLRRPGLLARAAGGALPRRGRQGGGRRGAARGGVPQHPRQLASHLPAVRRVRRGLQRGREEHPRPHLPVRGEQGRRIDPRPVRGAEPGAARRRALRRRCRRAPAGGGRSPGARTAGPHDHGERGRPVRRHPGQHVPAAGLPRRTRREQPRARHPVLRQRRHAGLRAAGRP